MLDVDDLPSRSYQSAAQSGGSPVRRLLDSPNVLDLAEARAAPPERI